MIRIHRSQAVPDCLLQDGQRRRARHEAEYAAEPAAYESRRNRKRFDFDRAIYAASEVKVALVRDQHKKCAYCEAKPLHVSSGDVEHYRPKAAVRQDETPADARQYPGYFWLAYEWDNLLFACESCNRRSKGNLFPLKDFTRRVRTPGGDLAQEEPLFINPASEDPELHITFREHVPIPKDSSPRGRATIEALGLTRQALNDDRREHLETFKLSLQTLDMLRREKREKELQRKLQKAIDKMTCPEAEYSLMYRTALKEWQAGVKRGKSRSALPRPL